MGCNDQVFGGLVTASEGLQANSCSILSQGSFRKPIEIKQKRSSSYMVLPCGQTRQKEKETERDRERVDDRQAERNISGLAEVPSVKRLKKSGPESGKA